MQWSQEHSSSQMVNVGHDMTEFACKSLSRKSIDTSALITGSIYGQYFNFQQSLRRQGKKDTATNSKSKYAMRL